MIIILTNNHQPWILWSMHESKKIVHIVIVNPLQNWVVNMAGNVLNKEQLQEGKLN